MGNEQLTDIQIDLIQQQVMEIMEDLDPTKGRLIQIKQGPRTALTIDSLLIGEPCYLTDDKTFVIGTGNGYIEFPNQEVFDNKELENGSITSEKLSQELNNLLNDLENSKVTVNDTLTSESTTEALSAKQGKVLDDKIKNLTDSSQNLTVVDNLNSTSTTDVLSAKQGKILNDTKAPKELATSTKDGLMPKEDKVKLGTIEEGATKTELVDNVITDDSTKALTAKQGKILSDRIDEVIVNNDITIVTDNLTSDSATEALSAKQGKILNDKIQNHIDNDVVLNVIDNLVSTSSVDVLSANQGRLLNNNKADKTLVTTSANGLMSSSDKSKLNGIETGATKTVVTDDLTSTSTTNALSANQGKVLNDKIQNLIDNPVGTTINDTLTSTSTSEALSANQGKVLNDKQNTHESKRASKSELGHVNAWEQGVNIPTSAWQGTTAPYTASISLADIKSTDNPLITPIYNIDYTIALNQRNNYAKIDDATTSTGIITFRCLEEKPDIQLSLLVKVVST